MSTLYYRTGSFSSSIGHKGSFAATRLLGMESYVYFNWRYLYYRSRVKHSNSLSIRSPNNEYNGTFLNAIHAIYRPFIKRHIGSIWFHQQNRTKLKLCCSLFVTTFEASSGKTREDAETTEEYRKESNSQRHVFPPLYSHHWALLSWYNQRSYNIGSLIQS